MFRSSIKTRAFLSIAALTAASLTAAAPAQADNTKAPEAGSESVQPLGVFDGDITNNLSSTYTVKIADLGGGSTSCGTWLSTGAGPSYACTTWWLPSGKADDQIRGSNFDTDAFMIESPYRVKIGTQAPKTYDVPAFRWVKIPDGSNANCSLSSGKPYCTVS
ncbi:hypothetical protein O7630_22065 [Micromonospora sp. WMMD718]|uniref:Secreted protein n=1 Tax=Micromonospora aurantiaca (nom. illeg.) TaxID=47850 RepID=A0ABQ6UMF4_9ACTN|nr:MULTISPECIES: hypothetical protein [Micromonospora]KAB1118388.1 hypothetical protein F6X54_03605 [Micromonospora aurantiaca]MDG4753637.1 hypothetical protein [Micromonospora sp. WMMD718]RNI01907.1 hypothetical protein EEZ25_15100 [Micromonospora aurantiaca]UFN93357.1 hypothetical protein LF814_25765 [Micromonospora aurantiaca]